MMTETELAVALDTYYQKCEELKTLTNECNKLKTVIIEAHNGQPTLLTEKYQSKLTSCTRLTLLEQQVKLKYNIDFDDTDYKATVYDRLSVKPLKT